MARGLARVGRTPREAVRDRRNAQRFGGAASLMFGGALAVDASGMIVLNLQTLSGLDQDATGLTVVVQDVLAIDASGIKLNFGTGLQSVASTLALDILNLTTDTIAAGDWVPFHDLADAPNKIAFSDFEATLSHNALADHVADEHIDWTNTAEDLLTTGSIEGDTITDGTAWLSGGILYADSWQSVADDPYIIAYYNSGVLDFGTTDITTAGVLSVASPIFVVNAPGYETFIGIGTATPAGPLELVQDGGTWVYPFYLTSYGSLAVPGFAGRHARGSRTSPAATQINDYLAAFAGRGYEQGVGFSTSSGAVVALRAAEIWTPGAHGSYIVFEVASCGDIARKLVLTIAENNVGIGTTTPARPLHIQRTDTFLRADRIHADYGAAWLLTRMTNTTTVASSWLLGPSNVAGVTGDDFAIIDYGTAIGDVIGDPRLVIAKTTGNVGIGTVAPSEKLDVVGSIIASGTHIGTPDEITATSGGVAASVATLNTEVTTNGDSDLDNVTLANGISGQIKHIYCVAEGNAADTWKITPATMVGGTQITFVGVGEGCTLIFADAEGWVVIGNNGGTIT